MMYAVYWCMFTGTGAASTGECIRSSGIIWNLILYNYGILLRQNSGEKSKQNEACSKNTRHNCIIWIYMICDGRWKYDALIYPFAYFYRWWASWLVDRLYTIATLMRYSKNHSRETFSTELDHSKNFIIGQLHLSYCHLIIGVQCALPKQTGYSYLLPARLMIRSKHAPDATL